MLFVSEPPERILPEARYQCRAAAIVDLYLHTLFYRRLRRNDVIRAQPAVVECGVAVENRKDAPSYGRIARIGNRHGDIRLAAGDEKWIQRGVEGAVVVERHIGVVYERLPRIETYIGPGLCRRGGRVAGSGVFRRQVEKGRDVDGVREEAVGRVREVFHRRALFADGGDDDRQAPGPRAHVQVVRDVCKTVCSVVVLHRRSGEKLQIETLRDEGYVSFAVDPPALRRRIVAVDRCPVRVAETDRYDRHVAEAYV